MAETFFKISGTAGKKALKGEISVGGAKNAALKVMAAAALFGDRVELSNVPEIEDVHRMGELLEEAGFAVEKSENRRSIIVPEDRAGKCGISSDISGPAARAMRSSIVLTGPILARTGSVSFPNPGGCSFGNRPIDLFIDGFKRLGADVRTEGETYAASAPNGLVGAEFFFKVQSHTGTETLMMAATLAHGTTVLKNCALEPEVKSLADFLNACGADIKGAGTPTITIRGRGGEPLRSAGKIYETMPDRIETGSFMILGALAGEKVVVKDCVPEHVEIVTEILRTAGVRVDVSKDSIAVYGADALSAVNVRTHEYPGLATDLQAPMAVFLTQAAGESALFETIYEGRLAYIPELVAMGADIVVQDTHRVLIKGARPLSGKKMKAPDLRAGFAFVIAAIVARGDSVIDNAYVIDRGYERLTERLTALGAHIERGMTDKKAVPIATIEEKGIV